MVGMNRIAGASLAALTLGGCFPYFTSYTHLEAPGIGHVGSACGDAGPPLIARYERRGVRFDLTLEPGYLRLRAPESMRIAIPDPVGHLWSGESDTTAIRYELTLAETVMRAGAVERRYDFKGLPARIDFTGRLRVPDVVVDGEPVVSPDFLVYRARYTGVAPAKC